MKIEELSLAGLKYFLDTVEAGSLTEAANKNFITRPAVSHAISRLEGWVGFPLLKHKKKTFELTLEGQKFYRSAKQGMREFSQCLQSEVKTLTKIRVGCSISLADLFLFPHLKKQSNLKGLVVKAGTSKQLVRNLEDGEINLALIIDEIPKNNFEAKIIHTGSFVLASKSGSLKGPLITTEDRGEVSLLRKCLNKKLNDLEIIQAESWSLCLKLATSLNSTCLIPDILLPQAFKPVRVPNFKPTFKVILLHRRLEFVSEGEAELIHSLSKQHR